jgi:hypothetical protein
MQSVREGVLPERRDVSVRERVMKGGEWVKRPAGAKGFESRRKCLSVAGAPRMLATVQCDKGVKNPPAEEVGLNLLICM